MSYAFTCPACGEVTCELATPLVQATLHTARVPTHRWQPPAEMLEPHEGPPISHDEVLAMHNILFGGNR